MTDHCRPSDPLRDPSDVLNAALDGMAGAGAGEVAELLAVARLVQATPLDAQEDAAPARLDALWEGVVAASLPKPVAASSQAVAFQALGTARAANPRPVVPRGGGDRRRSGLRAVTSWVSLTVMMAMLVGMGSMAWSLRPGGGGDHLLASATSLAVGTAYASPSPVATDTAWMRWPVPEDCDVVPMPQERYAEIMRTQPDISGHSYSVAGAPSQADADAAADVARRQFACEAFSLRDQERTLSSPAYLFFQSDSSVRTISRTEMAEADLTHSMLLSARIEAKAASAYVGVGDGVPPAASGMSVSSYFDTWVQLPAGQQFRQALAFDPANAEALADGRIAIPATMQGFGLDGRSLTVGEIAALDVVAPPLYVMARTSDGWVVDEVLTYCPFAGCGPVWVGLAEDGGVPVPTLDVPDSLPWTIPSGSSTATPVASPTSGGTATPAI
ncbi:MAG: hypothetical protein QM753_00590 [Thermomicrobiales bacterium]